VRGCPRVYYQMARRPVARSVRRRVWRKRRQLRQALPTPQRRTLRSYENQQTELRPCSPLHSPLAAQVAARRRLGLAIRRAAYLSTPYRCGGYSPFFEIAKKRILATKSSASLYSFLACGLPSKPLRRAPLAKGKVAKALSVIRERERQ